MAEPFSQRGAVAALGARALDTVEYIGGVWTLGVDTVRWTLRGLLGRGGRFSWAALAAQSVRVGVRSVGIIAMVQFFIGVILALQLAPQFQQFGFLSALSNVIGYAVFREMGPLISAVVLSGFAGASIAAEIGTMSVSEEIEALEAHALNPVRFLVVPRVLAAALMMLALCVVADLSAAFGGYLTGRLALPSEAYQDYWSRMGIQLTLFDFGTGLVKAAVFGLLISLIACYEGLKVRGGAEGVGKATTMTVVYSIVSLIGVDCIFTVIFYAWNV